MSSDWIKISPWVGALVGWMIAMSLVREGHGSEGFYWGMVGAWLAFVGLCLCIFSRRPTERYASAVCYLCMVTVVTVALVSAGVAGWAGSSVQMRTGFAYAASLPAIGAIPGLVVGFLVAAAFDS
jgi:hypothetical protein